MVAMLELAKWDAFADGERGLIAEQTSIPYYIDVSLAGAWQLWNYDAADEIAILANGHARNMRDAKAKAIAAALDKIAELAEFAAGDEATLDGHRQAKQPSRLAQAMRFFALVTLAVSSLLLLLIAGLYIAPWRTLAAAAIVCFVVFLVHMAIVAMHREAAMIEKLCSSTKAQYLDGKLDTITVANHKRPSSKPAALKQLTSPADPAEDKAAVASMLKALQAVRQQRR